MINSLKRIFCLLVTHNWEPEKYTSPDSCEMRRTCQRCGLSQETGIQHAWVETHVDGEVMQKCKRCGQIELAWPELEAVKGTEFTETRPVIKGEVATLNETENPKFQPLVSYWGPIVTHLLARIAAMTTWHADKPVNITRSTEQNSLVWKAEGQTWLDLGGSQEYFSP